MVKAGDMPSHVAIIMDGNGRWAKQRGLPRMAGHREGMQRAKEIIRLAAKKGIKVLTLFAFSAENWSRPKEEVDALMRFLDKFLTSQINELQKNRVRLIVIGRSDPLPKNIQLKLKDAQEETKGNQGLTLVLALNYGARQEILDAVKALCDSVVRGELNLEQVDEKRFSDHLYTAALPDPDLLIRTSGEMRLSNFLLWQLSYAELYFPKKYWPDFRQKDFEKALNAYRKRERRFGGVDAQKQVN